MWISVKDRLPDKNTPVWLFCQEDYQQQGYFVETIDYGDGEIVNLFKNIYDNYVVVTHYMPLPSPPTEER